MQTVLASRIDLEKINTLNLYSFYRYANTSLKQEIILKSKLVTFKPGFHIFHPGEIITHLVLFGSGSIKVTMVNDNGREITLYHLQAGEACPINILSILLDKPATVTAVAESKLNAITIDAVSFEKWVAQDAYTRKFALESFALRLTDVIALLQDIKFRKLEKRLADYLIKQLNNPTTSSTVINTTHMKIASELGSAREVISRLLRDLERQDVVHLSRGIIVIHNKKALQNIVDT